MRIRTIAARLAAIAPVALGFAGCSAFQKDAPLFERPLESYLPPMTAPGLTFPDTNFLGTPVTPNPLVVPTEDFDRVWNEAVKILDEYFDVASENRLSGQIITQPKVGATLLEPWASDSVGFRERLESTLQTIRRFSQVTIKPAPGGGLAVKVEVYKQLEDLGKPSGAYGGRAVYNNIFPINRTREVVGPIPIPLQWIDRGRDPKLEQLILSRIAADLTP